MTGSKSFKLWLDKENQVFILQLWSCVMETEVFGSQVSSLKMDRHNHFFAMYMPIPRYHNRKSSNLGMKF